MCFIEASGNLYKHKKNTKIFITRRDNILIFCSIFFHTLKICYKYIFFIQTHMSFYCIQKWNHAIKIMPSANVCMSPQRNFFPGALLFYWDSPFGGVALFPQGRNLLGI